MKREYQHERAASVCLAPSVHVVRVTYHGPTETKGARMVVRPGRLGRVRILPYDHGARDPYAAAMVRWLGEHDSVAERCIGVSQSAGEHLFIFGRE